MHTNRDACPHREVNTTKDLKSKRELLLLALLVEDHWHVMGQPDMAVCDMIPLEPVLCFNGFVPLEDTDASPKLFEMVALRDTITIADNVTVNHAHLLDHVRCLEHTEESDEFIARRVSSVFQERQDQGIEALYDAERQTYLMK